MVDAPHPRLAKSLGTMLVAPPILLLCPILALLSDAIVLPALSVALLLYFGGMLGCGTSGIGLRPAALAVTLGFGGVALIALDKIPEPSIVVVLLLTIFFFAGFLLELGHFFKDSRLTGQARKGAWAVLWVGFAFLPALTQWDWFILAAVVVGCAATLLSFGYFWSAVWRARQLALAPADSAGSEPVL